MLQRDVERRAARRQQLELRDRIEQRRDVGERPGEVLEVVDDGEHALAFREGTGERRDRLLALFLVDAESRRDRRDHEVGVRHGSEVDERRAPALSGRRDGERRLARAAWAGERDEARVVTTEERYDRGELARPADELRGGLGDGGPRRSGRGRGERRVVLEDASLERTQLGRRLEPELVERRAGVAVRGERVGLPARPVEGDDPLALEPLAVRMGEDERLELADDRGVTPGRQVEVDPRLEDRQPALVEARRRGLREGLVREVRERRPTPERECLAEVVRPGLREPLEAIDVELVGLDADEVPRRTGHDPVGAEGVPERVDVHLQRVRRARGRRLAPDPVDEPVGGDGLVRNEQELGEQRPRPRPPERHGHAVVAEHLQRPQQPELHPLRPLLTLLKPRFGGS